MPKRMKWLLGVILLLSIVLMSAQGMAATTWQPTGRPECNRIYALVVDPTTPLTVYVGTDRGVFKSTDGGGYWNTANSGLANTSIHSLAIDPSNPQTVYAGTGGSGIFKSTDGGGSWNTANSSLTNTEVLSLVIDPINPQTVYTAVFAGASYEGVYKSTDGGGSWKAVNSGLMTHNDVLSLAIDPTNPQILYAGTYSGGVFKSTNGGNSWTDVNNGLTKTNIISLAIAPSNPQIIYAGTDSEVLFKSTNGGNNWRVVVKGVIGCAEVLAIDPSTPQTVYVSGFYVYKSTNGGGSWINIDIGGNESVAALTIAPSNPKTIYAGTYAGDVFKGSNLDLPTISGIPATTASVGSSYSFIPTTTDNDNCNIAGNIPSGLKFDVNTCALSGTPTTVGIYNNIQIYVTNVLGSASLGFTITVKPPQTTIIKVPTNPSIHTSCSFNFISTWTESTFECKLDQGSFTACTSPTEYTGLAQGSHTFQVRAFDKVGNPDHTPAKHTWKIAAPLAISTTSPLPNGRVGAFYKKVLAAKGGVKPYAWSYFSGMLPDGLTFDAATGIISGKPLAKGSYSFTILLADNRDQAVTRYFTLTVK